MSAYIEGQNISLTRGDSLILDITITRNGDPYTTTEGDSVRFAMKRRSSDEAPVLIKYMDIQEMRFTFNPEDTKDLNIGKYRYDIELTTSDGYVDTFIGPAIFELTEEVY